MRWDPGFAARSPAFAPLLRAAASLASCDDFPPVDAYARMFGCEGHTSMGGAPLRFVVQDVRGGRPRRPATVADLYDGRIYLRGEVPTRPRSWHDLFNALVWASFPASKRAINARQYAALVSRLPASFSRLPGARTPEQDALAMLDEGGLLLVTTREARDEVTAAHREGDAARLSALHRERRLRVLVLGHALHEHLVSSTEPVRGRGVVLVAGGPLPSDPDALRAAADRALADLLSLPGGYPGTTDFPAVPLELATTD